MYQTIREQLVRVLDEAAQGNEDGCATMEHPADESRWVQLTIEFVNCSWPFTESPENLDSLTLPNCVTFSDFEPGVYATFEHDGESIEEIVSFVEDYFQSVLDLPANQQLKARFETL